MALQCKAVGEEVRPKDLAEIETVKPSTEKSRSTQVQPKTSTELMLNATEERRVWDPTVSTTMDHTSSLMVATGRNSTVVTALARRQEMERAAHTREDSPQLLKSII